MPKYQFNDFLRVGGNFIQFLYEDHGRSLITDQIQLKDMYNREFRESKWGAGDIHPNFSSVLRALIRSGKAEIHSGEVYFTEEGQRRHRQVSHPVPPVQHRGPGTASDLNPVQNTSDGEAQMGDRAKKVAKNWPLLSSDKHGVTVTSDPEAKEGRICLTVNEKEKVVRLYVKTSGANSIYFIKYWAKNNCFSLRDDHGVSQGKTLRLGPEGYEIQVHFRCSQAGIYRDMLVFEFTTDTQPSTDFSIVRYLEVTHRTSLVEALASTSPYQRRPIAPKASHNHKIVKGKHPERRPGMHLKTVEPLKYKDYKMPYYIKQLKNSNSRSNSSQLRRAKDVLDRPLSWENYTEKLQLLLYLEEDKMQKDLKNYDMVDVSMARHNSNNNLLLLQVPGVSEKRPSVLPGDQVLVTHSGQSGDLGSQTKYQGYVHHVDNEQVQLGFNKEFLRHFTEGMKFTVEFTVNRLTLCIQHRAAKLAFQHRLEEVLFPAEATSSDYQPQLRTLSMINSQLENNPEQRKAVEHIVAGSSKPAPYLVFGPPGTGKTVTVVEAIKQIERAQSSCHILACAPSNSAADVLCEKILDGRKPHKVFRFYACSQSVRQIPPKLQCCCNLEKGDLVVPSKEKLMEYKIMVTTLLTASRLVTGGIPPGHYTHIFVDEAGQAAETECIIPLAGLLKAKTGQIVLVGDPKQLGPIISCSMARKCGMEVSLLERLMRDFLMYKKDERGVFNNRFVTKLLSNYRSHPAILEIPNKLFYDGELEPCAAERKRNSYCSWKHLPREGFPLIFHGVVGNNDREANSPSFFNKEEVDVLLDYLKKLIHDLHQKGVTKIEPKHIGIIAPYRKQVEKIRKALKIDKDLRKENLENITIGSVEEFQGKESEVILVSTVRSNAKSTEQDQRFTLGFVNNEKRFNVAMTRAQALLIVVGNPAVLKTDPNWNEFIEYCSSKGGYCSIESSHAQGEEEMWEALSKLNIRHGDKPDTDESQEKEE
ncbi:putative helicase mov-10-B.1 [Centroberyx affinis]|uniref:putative helicase mov-10-B.1 n=1 Tax=Centroberyx affinis TaxID=166261 RepID=UPI003A5C0ADB